MLKKFKMNIIACKIEWYWKFLIIPQQKRVNRLINNLLAKGQSVYTAKILIFNRRLNRIYNLVNVLTEQYNRLAGIYN